MALKVQKKREHFIFSKKRTIRGGEAEGGMVKDHTFPPFFWTPSLTATDICIILHNVNAHYTQHHHEDEESCTCASRN